MAQTTRSKLRDLALETSKQAGLRRTLSQAKRSESFYSGDKWIYYHFAKAATELAKVPKPSAARASGRPVISEKQLASWANRLEKIYDLYEKGGDTNLRQAEREAEQLGREMYGQGIYKSTGSAGSDISELKRSMYRTPKGSTMLNARRDPVLEARVREMEKKRRAEDDAISNRNRGILRKRWAELKAEMKKTPGGKSFLETGEKRLERAVSEDFVNKASFGYMHFARLDKGWQYYKAGHYREANEVANSLDDSVLFRPPDQVEVVPPDQVVKEKKSTQASTAKTVTEKPAAKPASKSKPSAKSKPKASAKKTATKKTASNVDVKPGKQAAAKAEEPKQPKTTRGRRASGGKAASSKGRGGGRRKVNIKME